MSGLKITGWSSEVSNGDDDRNRELLQARYNARWAYERPLVGDWVLMPNSPEYERSKAYWLKENGRFNVVEITFNASDTYTVEEHGNTHHWERFSHDWGDDIQTCYGGSFHIFKSGNCSFSGGLNPSIKKEWLVERSEVKPASYWFFHHDSAGAHRGVDVSIPTRVWLYKPS